MEDKKKKSLVIHPFLFAVFPIIFLFAINIDIVPAEEIILPILASLLVAFSLWIFLSLILKNKHKSGLIVSLGLVLFFTFGHFYNLFENSDEIIIPHEIFLLIFVALFGYFSLWVLLCISLKIKHKSGLIVSLGLVLFFTFGHFYNLFENSDEIIIPQDMFLPIFLIVFIIGTYFLIKTKKKLNNATTIVNFVALTLVVISGINVGTYYLDSDNFFEPTRVENDKKIDESKIMDSYPDIYYIILDEYADSDKLMKYFDYDNQEFIYFLEEKGFHVASESYSNYYSTWDSIPSTLNMDYIHLKPKEFDFSLTSEIGISIPSSQFLTANSKVMEYLQSKGYEVVSINSAIFPTNTKGIADHYFCFDEDTNYSEFLPLLFETSMLNPLNLQIWGADIRDQRLCSFSALMDLDNISEKPKFVLSHILLPHAPYIFGPNGEPKIVGSFLSAPTQKSWDPEGYIDNLQFANKKMKEVIEKLLDDEDPPVILLYSDHGFRDETLDFGGLQDFKHGISTIGAEHLEKRYNNLEAYYFPDKPRNFLLEKTTNVNTFRIIFNEYFNDNFEILDDKIYGPPNFTDYTEMLFSTGDTDSTGATGAN